MHRSRLAGFIVDCRTDDLDAATYFWSAALGMPQRTAEGDLYVALDASARDLAIEVQKVEHESRVHLDIETDDIEAEVRRLEGLGAKRVAQMKTWWVLEAPTGQRFCVIRAKGDLTNAPGANTWSNT
jgi:catechol 2,3-dioxygenase-like lactoylglutathione lyase family enzyme